MPHLLLSGSWDYTIRMWDTRTAATLQVCGSQPLHWPCRASERCCRSFPTTMRTCMASRAIRAVHSLSHLLRGTRPFGFGGSSATLLSCAWQRSWVLRALACTAKPLLWQLLVSTCLHFAPPPNMLARGLQANRSAHVMQACPRDCAVPSLQGCWKRWQPPRVRSMSRSVCTCSVTSLVVQMARRCAPGRPLSMRHAQRVSADNALPRRAYGSWWTHAEAGLLQRARRMLASLCTLVTFWPWRWQRQLSLKMHATAVEALQLAASRAKCHWLRHVARSVRERACASVCATCVHVCCVLSTRQSVRRGYLAALGCHRLLKSTSSLGISESIATFAWSWGSGSERWRSRRGYRMRTGATWPASAYTSATPSPHPHGSGKCPYSCARHALQLAAEERTDAVPYFVATGAVDKLVNFFVGRGQLRDAFIVGQVRACATFPAFPSRP